MSAASGSLALARATLFVGTHAKTATVRAFDLGGRELGLSFSFRDPATGRSAVAGLALDEDHALWIADTPAGRVRRFSLFGREIGGFGAGPGGEAALLPGTVRQPVDVEAREGLVVVAGALESPHALQCFEAEAGYRARFPSLGDPARPFQGLGRLAASGARLFVTEAGARRVQVFRAHEFHFAFQLRDARGQALEPCAVAALEDGRAVVAVRSPESALVLCDASGRPVRVLARHGEAEGCLDEPCDLVLEPGEDERRARLYVLDRAATRLQVFTLEGACQGAISIEPARQVEIRDRSKPARDRKKGGR